GSAASGTCDGIAAPLVGLTEGSGEPGCFRGGGGTSLRRPAVLTPLASARCARLAQLACATVSSATCPLRLCRPMARPLSRCRASALHSPERDASAGAVGRRRRVAWRRPGVAQDGDDVAVGATDEEAGNPPRPL